MLDLCRRHNPVALVVEMHVNYVSAALLHPHLLLAEWAEKVFHQSPVEECPVLVYPRHLKVSEVAHPGQWRLRSGNEPFLTVQVDEDVKFVALLHTVGHIPCRQQHLAFVAAVKVNAEIHQPDHGHAVVVA